MTGNRNRPKRCDACGKTMRPSHHELHLSDLSTGQWVGSYHAGPGAHEECMAQAQKYRVPGVVLLWTVVHPDRCGEDQEHCDMGARRSLA